MTSRQPGPDDAETIQRRIRQAREHVPGGRGPGASPLQTSRWMRERPSLGGEPPAASREKTAEQALLARGDPADLQRLIARRSARLALTLAGAGITLTVQAAARRTHHPRQQPSRAPRAAHDPRRGLSP